MSSADLSLYLHFLIVGACCLAAIKLWRIGLYRRYRALWWFLLCVAAFDALVLVPRDASVRTVVWEIFQPLTWFFSVWVILELYTLILERHKGLSTLGRWVQYAGFSISLLVSLVAMVPKSRADGFHIPPLIAYYYAIERGIDCGMLVFLLVLLVWLSRYPVPLSRNLVIHSAVYSLLFFSNSLGTFSEVFFGMQVSARISLVLSTVFACCILGWTFFLTQKGEETRVILPKFDPDQEARILHQLDALNNVLLKVSKN